MIRHTPSDFALDELLECWRTIARAGCQIRICSGADGMPQTILSPPKGQRPPAFALDAAKRAKAILHDLAAELAAHTWGNPVPRANKSMIEPLLTLAAMGLRIRVEQWRAAGGRGDLPQPAQAQIDASLTKHA